MIDVKFFGSIGVPVYTIEGEKPVVINQDDLDAFKSREAQLNEIRPKLDLTIGHIGAALDFMHETGDYESEALDTVHEHLVEAHEILKKMVK